MRKERFSKIDIEEMFYTDDFIKWSVDLYGLEIMHIIRYKESNIIQDILYCDSGLIHDVFNCEYDEFKAQLLLNSIFVGVAK